MKIKTKYFFFLILLLLLSMLCSCNFLDRYDPGFVERNENNENIKKLKKGMTKEEVVKIMGNPLVDEKYNTPNIWFYYTDWDWADAARTEIECTPLVFEKGVLAGWGRVYYRNYKHQDWKFNDKETMQSVNNEP